MKAARASGEPDSITPSTGLLRWTGWALAAGGALTILINVGLTPFLLAGDRPFTEVAASQLFLWRQSLSALVAALLLFGAIGLYLRHAERAGRFGAFAFVLAVLGSALLLAWEWIDVFILRDLAQRAPDTLQLLEEGKGLSLYDLAALIPASVFALGWITLAASVFRCCPTQRRPAALAIAAFFVIPFLSAAVGPVWGGALGNLVLGSALIALGWPQPASPS